MIVSTSHRVCTMKNIDFTDFFNVFLSGATIMDTIYDAKILIVDDNAELLALLCEQLCGAGYSERCS